MKNIPYKDYLIPIQEDMGETYITLWGVRGLNRDLYPSKIIAEGTARINFIAEDIDSRYNRIYSIRVLI